MPNKNILLIEDNSVQAKQTTAILEKDGYQVTVAENGATGFKLAKTRKPDLILLDMILPDFAGNQICQWLKQDTVTRSVPLIMLTARSSLEDKVAGLKVGADDYLAKPFHDQELLARIEVCLRIKIEHDDLRGQKDQLEGLLKEVEQKAITDALTGLHNRRHYNDLLDKEFSRAKRFNEPLTCLMLDLDHFKSINDSYGHPVGDSVLSEAGKILKGMVRLFEIACRYGGEEFALLLPKTGMAEALKPAGRILECFATCPFKGLPNDRLVTVSIGIAALPDPNLHTKEDLIRCADYALYKAKGNGRNRIETSSGSEMSRNMPG